MTRMIEENVRQLTSLKKLVALMVKKDDNGFLPEDIDALDFAIKKIKALDDLLDEMV